MDNKNDKQEEPKEDLQPVQGDSSFAEIGEEGKGNNTTPNGKEDETINNWVKEIPDSFEEQSEDITETLVNVPVNKGDLPDWINTISPEEPENLESDGNLQEKQDNPKPIHFESKDDSRSTEQPLNEERINEQFQGQENIVENHEYLDDGFVEISGYDLDEGDKTTKEPEISDEVNDEQEELPDWLEDMITESPETSSEIKENITEENITEESIFSSDEPTRPVQIVELSNLLMKYP